ncbi:MAG: transcriptional regulator [Candidatus Heimdallarchaeota archaeon]|nr:transcriptional regulator [Candidatus Heimdallarchaeota archaeon]
MTAWKKTLNLDPSLHSPTRIAILLFLIPISTANFNEIQRALDLSPGNLSKHLKKLEGSQFITISKHFVNAKPLTVIGITSSGYSAILSYTDILVSVLRNLE